MNRLLSRLRALDLDRGPRSSITLSEAVLCALIAAIAVAGWASLGLAIVGLLTRGALLVVAVGCAVIVGVGFRRWPPPPVVHDHGDVIVLLACLIAAVFYLPGADYLFGDKDPGVYATHAFAIARHGSTEIPDEVGVRLTGFDGGYPQGGRFAGYWYSSNDRVAALPQFFHMFPALLASAKLIFGSTAVLQANPIIGIISIGTLTAVTRRAFGIVVAGIAGVVMATNMVNIFFAKWPSTETLAQLVLAGMALLVILAMETNWAPFALLAGVLASISFLNRPDGVLIVFLAVGAIAFAVATFVDTRLIVAGSIGLIAPLPWVWFQAYERNAAYARGNGVPSDRVVLALAVAALVAGFGVRRFAPGFLPRLVPRSQAALHRLAVATLLVVGAWAAFSGLRPRLLGETIQRLPNRPELATLDEVNLRRLFFFFNPAGLVLFWIGVAVVVVIHRRRNAWVLLAPGLALLPVYIWKARISPRLMWWGRRFVPAIVPVIAIVIAVAAVWLLVRRGRWQGVGRLVAIGCLTLVLGTQLYQSRRLIGYREWDGSGGFLEQVEDLAGGDDVVLVWESPTSLVSPSALAAGAMWFVHDRNSLTLRAEPTPNDLDRIADAFPGDRLIVFTHYDDLPPNLDPTRLEPIGVVAADVTQWGEARTTVPLFYNTFPLRMRAWSFEPN